MEKVMKKSGFFLQVMAAVTLMVVTSATSAMAESVLTAEQVGAVTTTVKDTIAVAIVPALGILAIMLAIKFAKRLMKTAG